MNRPEGVYAAAVQSDLGRPGELDVEFFSDPNPENPPNYSVVATDYDTYTVVYNCSDKLGGMASYDVLNILAREKELSDDQILDIIKIVEERIPGYNFFKNTKVNRQGFLCPYDKFGPAPEQ